MNITFLLILIVALLKITEASIQDKFCGKYNCYTELELTRDATIDEIKKSYRKLSRKYHPDMQRYSDIKDTQGLQQRINAAYETLNDPEIRKSYDFFLDHPEYNQMHHYYNYYKAYYLPQIDPSFVITIFILLMSSLQYFGRKTMYQRALKMVQQSDTFKREVNLRFNDPKNKKKIEQDEKDFLVSLQLWIKNNLDTYNAEQEKIMKEQQQKLFQQSGKYKRYVRYMKNQK
ncbi:DnaJ domain [Pseudocohnilembus persalinus]|uniref:DnaJ domain n=1 Tax=Pseudocohnilembus persalinus TaxID=266149 RepID=A0A0V0QIQ3_PSEPJ|nr:DnaJ domain [Pseudocohnilembus persalinus]|eukprot:KRX02055.1 DnaJ domain [Pseudocohnilembus persalinus]